MDADLSLEVTAPSLGGGRSENIQEERSDVDFLDGNYSVKHFSA